MDTKSLAHPWLRQDTAREPRPWRSRLYPCAGCSEKFPGRELTECVDGGGSFANHDNLAFFDGDLVCPECADRSGVIR